MLFLTPDRFLDFLGIGLHTPLARTVAILLLIKMALVTALLVYVTFRRAKRKWQRRNNHARASQFRDHILDFVFANDDEKKNFIPKFKSSERYFFRRILLNQLENVEGAERVHLIYLYKHFHFLEEDRKALSSYFWWNRLSAVIRLEVVRSQESTTDLIHLIEDKNDLVAIAAMRGLSALEFPDKISKILYSLSRRAPERRDIFVEILSNIGKGQVEKIIEYLNECFDPYIAAVCVSVLGSLKAKEAVPLCVSLLSSSDDEVAAEAARALGKIQDSQAIPFLKKELQHESAKVRAEVIVSLLSLGDTEFKLTVSTVQDDPSLIVRRALFDAGRAQGSGH